MKKTYALAKQRSAPEPNTPSEMKSNDFVLIYKITDQVTKANHVSIM
jgi:hypothetical protein